MRLPPKLRDLAAPADAATDTTTPVISGALDTLALVRHPLLCSTEDWYRNVLLTQRG